MLYYLEVNVRASRDIIYFYILRHGLFEVLIGLNTNRKAVQGFNTKKGKLVRIVCCSKFLLSHHVYNKFHGACLTLPHTIQ